MRNLNAKHVRRFVAGVAILFGIGAAHGADKPLNPQDYPRTLAEMKVALDSFEPAAKATQFETAPKGFTAGKVAAESEAAYLRRMQQYRYLCGLPYDDLQIDEGCQNLAQHAALICARIGGLNHKPPKPGNMPDDIYKTCFKGTSESNLFAGLSDPVPCVDGWMDDSDASNIGRLGHRRWILNPGMLKTGFGSVERFAAMYAFDHSRKGPADWETVLYPCKGFMPSEFFGERYAWSVIVNPQKVKGGVNGQIKVSVTALDGDGKATGEPLKIDFFNVDNGGYGGGWCIVFRLAGLKLDGAYRVTIDGLAQTKAAPGAYSYLVHFAKLASVADGPEIRAVYTALMNKRLAAVLSTPDPLDRHDAIEQFLKEPLLAKCDEALAKKAAQTLADMERAPSMVRELDARKLYEEARAAEQKAGDDVEKLKQAAELYRALGDKHRVTRAGAKALADFERLKPKTGLK